MATPILVSPCVLIATQPAPLNLIRKLTPGSFGQSRFPQSLNQHFGARFAKPRRPSDKRRYRCERRIDLKHASRRLARLSITTEIVANHYLETDMEKLKAAASMGYARGKLIEEAKVLPRDRKD